MKYIEKHCLFCKDDSCNIELYSKTFNENDLNPEVFSARRVTEHFHYRMVKCANTGLIFSKEILPDDELSVLYAESKVTFNEYSEIIRKDYWKPFSKYIAGIQKNNALEIGCSNGFFLDELAEQGFENVFGCEPSREAVEMASAKVKPNIFNGFFSDNTYEDNFFDLICCFQTLDHLSNPDEFLEICYRKLKPQGILYVIVHNTNGLQYKIFKEKSPIIDVEHIYLFNPRNITLLMQNTGFSDVNVIPVKNSYPLKYWLEHAPIPFKKFFVKTAQFTGISKITLSVNFGNMGVISFKHSKNSALK